MHESDSMTTEKSNSSGTEGKSGKLPPIEELVRIACPSGLSWYTSPKQVLSTICEQYGVSLLPSTRLENASNGHGHQVKSYLRIRDSAGKMYEGNGSDADYLISQVAALRDALEKLQIPANHEKVL